MPVVNGRGRSGSDRYQAESVGFGDRKPDPLTSPGAEITPRLSRHKPVLSGNLDATGSSAVMAVEGPVAGRQSGAGCWRAGFSAIKGNLT